MNTIHESLPQSASTASRAQRLKTLREYKASKDVLIRQYSKGYEILTRKSGTPNTRTRKKQMSCRMTLLERIMCLFLNIRGDITRDQRAALDEMVKEILKNQAIHDFISMNQSKLFLDTGMYDATKMKDEIRRIASGKSKRRYSSRSGSSRRRPSRHLFPIIFFRENGTIPHYCILYYQNGKWYIYSSYGSDYVCIGTQKIELDNIQEFFDFIDAMDKPLGERSDEDEKIIRDFMTKYFLANPVQPFAKCENDQGDTVDRRCDIKMGIKAEIEEYLKERVRVAHVPSFTPYVGELMKTIYKPEYAAIGIRLSTSSAASASAAAVEPGHRTNT
uniref:Uncharacterized protein n=1 Tax=viral metagenome TaxID=1070528 RepID=A0A6C0HN97_9ZZZZ